MSELIFTGVEEAESGGSLTLPGTIDVFEIKSVEFGASKNKGTQYMGVEFGNDTSSFKHSFYLTPPREGSKGTLPRVVSLFKAATLEAMPEKLLEEQLKIKLTGKKVALKVTAKIDPTNGKAYPDMSYGGFCAPVSEINKLKFTPQELELNAQAAKIRLSGTSGGSGSFASTPSSETKPLSDELAF